MTRPTDSAGLGRAAALAARPLRAEILGAEEKDGKLHLTVELGRPRWQRLLGAEPRCRRTFALDALGQEVYRLCDGRNSVGDIVRRFGAGHNLCPADAETSVTAFLKTLMSKGLVGMEMDIAPGPGPGPGPGGAGARPGNRNRDAQP